MPLREDGYIFQLDKSVDRTPVRFTGRYGVEIAADLYRELKGRDRDVNDSRLEPCPGREVDGAAEHVLR